MKKLTKKWIIAVFIGIILCVVGILSIKNHIYTERLEKNEAIFLTNVWSINDSVDIPLSELATFEWDHFFIYEPYTPTSKILENEQIDGFFHSYTSRNDDEYILIFTREKNVVCFFVSDQKRNGFIIKFHDQISHSFFSAIKEEENIVSIETNSTTTKILKF